MSAVENRVGSNVPTADVLAKYLKQLTDIAAEMRKFSIVLTTDERRSMLRARKGSEVMMERVVEIAKKHGMSVPGVSLEELSKDIVLMKALRPFEDALAAMHQLAADTVAQSETEAWQACLAYYAVLSSAAPRHAALADELAPIKEFMSHKRKAKAQDPAL